MHIRFGSDGFRGVIGHTFTRDTVARIGLGVAAYLRETTLDWAGQTIPIGYDTRFLSREVARYMANLLAGAGLNPLLSNRPCPSPYLAYAVRHFAAPIGIQITASHNPPHYGGIKLKGRHGGSMFPAHADLVEALANAVDPGEIPATSLINGGKAPNEFNVDRQYTNDIWAAARWSGNPETSLLADFMHGATAGIYQEILTQRFDLDTVLNTETDPFFGGHKPEPTPAALTELAQLSGHDGRNSIGLAFDGDGDRLAVIDETGRYLAPHEIFCILLEHLVAGKAAGEVVVTTVSFSGLVERVARAHGLLVLDVPVGFKHVSHEMVQHQAIMGGEESGGTGFGHHLPERDALLMALLLLHARENSGTTLNAMVEQLYATYGRPVFVRRDVVLDQGIDTDYIRQMIRSLASLDHLAGDEVTGLNHRDGMKLKTAEGWVLVRASGTEPLLRIYAEADSKELAGAYADAVVAALALKPA